MQPDRQTSTIVGLLFVAGTASGILSTVFTGPVLGAAEPLQSVASHGTELTIGALLVLVMGFTLALVPVVMYPVAKAHNQTLAVGYLVFRGALETMTYLAIAVCMLLLAGAPHPPAWRLEAWGPLVLRAQQLASVETVFAFGLGASMFYTLLYQARLVPRWISIWGLIAIALHLVTGILLVLGLQRESSPSNTVMNLPIFFQELVMAGWLIVKGFDVPSRRIPALPRPTTTTEEERHGSERLGTA